MQLVRLYGQGVCCVVLARCVGFQEWQWCNCRQPVHITQIAPHIPLMNTYCAHQGTQEQANDAGKSLMLTAASWDACNCGIGNCQVHCKLQLLCLLHIVAGPDICISRGLLFRICDCRSFWRPTLTDPDETRIICLPLLTRASNCSTSAPSRPKASLWSLPRVTTAVPT